MLTITISIDAYKKRMKKGLDYCLQVFLLLKDIDTPEKRKLQGIRNCISDTESCFHHLCIINDLYGNPIARIIAYTHCLDGQWVLTKGLACTGNGDRRQRIASKCNVNNQLVCAA